MEGWRSGQRNRGTNGMSKMTEKRRRNVTTDTLMHKDIQCLYQVTAMSHLKMTHFLFVLPLFFSALIFLSVSHRSDIQYSALKSMQNLLSLGCAFWIGKCVCVKTKRQGEKSVTSLFASYKRVLTFLFFYRKDVSITNTPVAYLFDLLANLVPPV